MRRGLARFGIFEFVGLVVGWLGAQGIPEVPLAQISIGCPVVYPALFKLRFVAAFGVSGGALVILLGRQCHKLFQKFR